MSFNRSKYDDCTYKHQLKESIGTGDYMTNAPRNCDNCVYYSPSFALDGKGVGICDKKLIDVDSELLGITRKYSRCPADKYLPSKEPFCKNNFNNLKECNDLIAEPTLISNPKCTLHETTINRFEWLCRNPQDNALVPFDFLINNRLIVKNAHRPLIERPIDQSSALPPACNNNVVYDWASRYSQGTTQLPSHQLANCRNIPQL